jgi:hypothetical protein
VVWGGGEWWRVVVSDGGGVCVCACVRVCVCACVWRLVVVGMWVVIEVVSDRGGEQWHVVREDSGCRERVYTHMRVVAYTSSTRTS